MENIESNNNDNIHNIDVNVICDFFIRNHRQGPGSDECTQKAYGFLSNIDGNSVILDLGCGTGTQSFALAEVSLANIIAIDLFEPFISVLNAKSKAISLQDRVTGRVGSMDDLSFEKGSIDAIWCEGAIYNIGFKKGISYWYDFLKSGGYLAVSESVWLTKERPAEIQNFWNECYPEIDTIDKKKRQLESVGYKVISIFVLPENCWTENYYVPMEGVKAQFLKDNAGNAFAENFISHITHEVEMYAKYGKYYGYAFFVAQKM